MKFYRQLPEIKAICFDLDDTLYNNMPYIMASENLLLTHLKSSYTCAKDTDISFWRKCRDELVIQFPKLRSDMAQLRKKVLFSGLFKLGMRGDALRHAVERAYALFYFARSDFQVEQTIKDALHALGKKVPLVAITNGNVNLQQIGIAEYFDLALLANSQQPMKPHPMMFQKAQAFLDVEPANILHVGDNMEKDVWGAKRQGFSTAWFAVNRDMDISGEKLQLLPDISLSSLDDLLSLV